MQNKSRTSAVEVIELRQKLLNDIEQNQYSYNQIRSMLLAMVSSCHHYWDLHMLEEAANKVNNGDIDK